MADKQLPIPDAANRDPKSFELVRVWIANNEQHLSLRLGVWNDPTAWGVLLADVARHVANSYQLGDEVDSLEILSRIKAGFYAGLDSASNPLSGEIVR